MALGIAASLIGVYSPRTVQIVVTGMTPGADYEIVGNWPDGSWPVRAGTGTADDTQLVLSDLSTPINTQITYTVTHGGVEVVSDEIVVDYPHKAVLQSLSGDVSVPLDLRDNQAPQRLTLRQSPFMIPGRARPVVLYDIAGGETGELRANTDGTDTRVLKALLKSGAPLLMRTDGNVCDLDAVSFLSFTGASSSLIVGTRRRWQLDYQVIDDPEPDALIGLPTWDDFDAAYDGLTWADFDAEFTGLTWANFDRIDWATRAAS